MGKYKNILIILFISAMGGSAGIFFKIALREIPPDLFTFLRFSFAFLAFLPFLFSKTTPVTVDRKKLILISFIATANIVFFIFGLQYTTATISGILYAVAPLMVGILSWKITREQISLSEWLGISIGFLGALAIIVAPKLGVVSTWNGSLFGNLIIASAVISFSLYSVLSKKYQNLYSPMVLTKYFVFTTIVTQVLLMSFHFSPAVHLLGHISLKVWIIIIYAGVLDTALYYFLYQYVIKRASPVLASMTFYLQPIFAIIAARLILGEKITPIFFFSTIAIFLGITLVFRDRYFSKFKVNS